MSLRAGSGPVDATTTDISQRDAQRDAWWRDPASPARVAGVSPQEPHAPAASDPKGPAHMTSVSPQAPPST